jgi:hypothetical protein
MSAVSMEQSQLALDVHQSSVAGRVLDRGRDLLERVGMVRGKAYLRALSKVTDKH